MVSLRNILEDIVEIVSSYWLLILVIILGLVALYAVLNTPPAPPIPEPLIEPHMRP